MLGKKWKYIETMVRLARIVDSSEACRRHHCYKVERYSLIICRELKLSSREIKIVKIASMLHDIGKIGIDLSIIRKPAKLQEEEWVQIRRHPEIGAHIVTQLGFLDEIVPIIKHHHARFGGGGYPDPDKKDGHIPLGSRIIMIADAFDAMMSDRPYRKALSKEAAVGELERCSGSQFDPDIVNVFLDAIKV